jgi:hypothetical protein
MLGGRAQWGAPRTPLGRRVKLGSRGPAAASALLTPRPRCGCPVSGPAAKHGRTPPPHHDDLMVAVTSRSLDPAGRRVSQPNPAGPWPSSGQATEDVGLWVVRRMAAARAPRGPGEGDLRCTKAHRPFRPSSLFWGPPHCWGPGSQEEEMPRVKLVCVVRKSIHGPMSFHFAVQIV